MSVFHEIRHRTRHVLMPSIAICLLLYFTYHAVQGERGLIALWHLSEQLETARIAVAEVAETRQKLERRVSLLRPDSLDLDMLDEQARRVLDLVHPRERVILDEGGVTIQ